MMGNLSRIIFGGIEFEKNALTHEQCGPEKDVPADVVSFETIEKHERDTGAQEQKEENRIHHAKHLDEDMLLPSRIWGWGWRWR